jgi:hypothetical protein
VYLHLPSDGQELKVFSRGDHFMVSEFPELLENLLQKLGINP